MCKIYPPPFNKFVVFIFYCFYCLLSITSALDCGTPLTPSKKINTVVGYVKPGTDPKGISWDLYDYINIVHYERPTNPKEPKTKELFKKFFDSRSASKANSKIFLSIRPKDPIVLAQLADNPGRENDVKDLVDFVTINKFDGVDIEYPGKRGAMCKTCDENDSCVVWDKVNDQQFVEFLVALKAKLPQTGKSIMVTVGEHDTVLALHGIIDFLNIETYHHSTYDNMKNPPLNPPGSPFPVGQELRFRSTSNSPLNIFEGIYKNYSDLYAGSVKIIMGIDFGNTLQIVTNPEIVNNQTVDFFYNPKDPREQAIRGLTQDNVIAKIESPCSDDQNPINTPPSLYSWPWKSLWSSDYCNMRPDWNYKFDKDNASTPWLTKNVDESSYYFVSYEDIDSINLKLQLIKEGGGISISDISYDDSKNTLVNFIRGKSPNPASSNTPPSTSATGNTTASNPSHTSDSSNNNLNKGGPKVGAIVGSIFGVLAVVALAAASFILWRRKNQLPIFTNKELPGIHTTPKEYNEMTTEPNRFNTPTTVLPVSSTGYVTAMFDFEGKEANDLSFRKGDKIEVLERGDGPNDWWVGRVNGAIGEFPGNYVKETGL